eukprot:TRINITY_DN26709_c0_g2_i1.p1 TRINITY_DN26709_c0_g2~~TRINITY_DN26709_c0_g2_i1.p1  ORF type:complete len:214 (+),score=23.32 TRINITY_DN26709_c0_g2_i1:120-761(+)
MLRSLVGSEMCIRDRNQCKLNARSRPPLVALSNTDITIDIGKIHLDSTGLHTQVPRCRRPVLHDIVLSLVRTRFPSKWLQLSTQLSRSSREIRGRKTSGQSINLTSPTGISASAPEGEFRSLATSMWFTSNASLGYAATRIGFSSLLRFVSATSTSCLASWVACIASWTSPSIKSPSSQSSLSLIHISEPTRLLSISYAVFCLKKKKKKKCRF